MSGSLVEEQKSLNSDEMDVVLDTAVEWFFDQDSTNNPFPDVCIIYKDENVRTDIRERLLKLLKERSFGKRKGYIHRNIEKLTRKTLELANILIRVNFYASNITENLTTETENARNRIDLHMIAGLSSSDARYFLKSLENTPYPVDPKEKGLFSYLSEEHVISTDMTDFLEEPARKAFYREGCQSIPAGDEFRLLQPLLQNIYEEKVCNDEDLPPLLEQLKDKFRKERDFEKYIEGKDFSKGIADINDAEFSKRVDKVKRFINELVDNDEIEKSQFLELKNFPVSFLQTVPVIDGKWIDLEAASLIEYYRALAQKEYLVKPSLDPHTFAIPFVMKEDGHTAEEFSVLESISTEARDFIDKLYWDKRVIRGRQHIPYESFAESSGKNSAHEIRLKKGFKTSSLNKWVDSVLSEDEDIIEGIKPFHTGLSARRAPLNEMDGEHALQKRLERNQRSLRVMEWDLHAPVSFSNGSDGLEDGTYSKPYRGHSEPARKELSEIREQLVSVYSGIHTLGEALDTISTEIFDGRNILRENTAEKRNIINEKIEELISDFNIIKTTDLDQNLAGTLLKLEDCRGEYSWGKLFPDGFEIFPGNFREIIFEESSYLVKILSSGCIDETEERSEQNE